jgi:hypothetical protein
MTQIPLSVPPPPQAIKALMELIMHSKDPLTRLTAAQHMRIKCHLSDPVPPVAVGRAWDVAVTRIQADYHVQDAYHALGETLEYNKALLPVHVHLRE